MMLLLGFFSKSKMAKSGLLQKIWGTALASAGTLGVVAGIEHIMMDPRDYAGYAYTVASLACLYGAKEVLKN